MPPPGGMHDLLRRCALAVLTSGSASDDPRAAQELLSRFRHPGAAAGPRRAASTCTTRRRWPSSMARSSAASPNCCSPSCATSPTPRSRLDDSGRSTSTAATASPTPCSASCATRACCSPTEPEPGRVLGRPLDRPRRIPLHQAGRLRARPARPRHLHRLRPGCDEGPDEGRDDRATPSSAAARRATSASPSPASSRPNRRTRSSTTW